MRFTCEEEVPLPLSQVRCPFCEAWVTTDGWTVMEALWMHEYDCSAIRMDWELAAA